MLKKFIFLVGAENSAFASLGKGDSKIHKSIWKLSFTQKKKTPRKTKKYRYNWSIINSYPNSAEDEATRYRPDPTEPKFA